MAIPVIAAISTGMKVMSAVNTAKDLFSAVQDRMDGANQNSFGNAGGGLFAALAKGVVGSAGMIAGAVHIGGADAFNFNRDGTASLTSKAGAINLDADYVGGQNFSFGEGVQVRDQRGVGLDHGIAVPRARGAQILTNTGAGSPKGPTSM